MCKLGDLGMSVVTVFLCTHRCFLSVLVCKCIYTLGKDRNDARLAVACRDNNEMQLLLTTL